MVHEPLRHLRVALTRPLEEHPRLLRNWRCHHRHGAGSFCQSDRQQEQVPTLDEIVPHVLLLDVGATLRKVRVRAVLLQPRDAQD
eukprot:16437218-Heterocapsa_arctica.AAC.1